MSAKNFFMMFFLACWGLVCAVQEWSLSGGAEKNSYRFPSDVVNAGVVVFSSRGDGNAGFILCTDTCSFSKKMQSKDMSATTHLLFGEYSGKPAYTKSAIVTAFIPDTRKSQALVSFTPACCRGCRIPDCYIDIVSPPFSSPKTLSYCQIFNTHVDVMHFLFDAPFQDKSEGVGVYMRSVMHFASLRHIRVSLGLASYCGRILEERLSEEFCFCGKPCGA